MTPENQMQDYYDAADKALGIRKDELDSLRLELDIAKKERDIYKHGLTEINYESILAAINEGRSK